MKKILLFAIPILLIFGVSCGPRLHGPTGADIYTAAIDEMRSISSTAATISSSPNTLAAHGEVAAALDTAAFAVDVPAILRALGAALDAYDRLRVLAPSLPPAPLWVRRLFQGCTDSDSSPRLVRYR